MAKLIIEIDDLLLTQALLKSQSEQISLDDFIDDALRKILPETNLPTEVVNSIESMLSKAVERANQKKSGERFILRRLFENSEWQTLGTAVNKNAFGRLFRRKIETQETVILLDERQGRIAVYEKL